MLHRESKEPNFIEKRRQWKSKVEKPLSRRTLLMVLPALILSVFVMLSAPYLKIMVTEFMKDGDDLSITVPIDTADDEEVEEDAGPPPNPDIVIRDDYRKKLEAEGFDWRKAPEVEGPDLSFARERELEVKPIDVELPNTLSDFNVSTDG